MSTTAQSRPFTVVPHVATRRLGRWTIHAIQAGGVKLDGGAMFGVVPKTLWSRRIAADEQNRIQLGMRCLLVEHESGLVLVDDAAGGKEDAKFHDIYGVENRGEDGRTWLEAGLASLGVRPEDVSLVIDTHLHFDHAGGNTVRAADGSIQPAFPKARYVVQRGEYHYATHTNERTAGSYFPHNFVPLYESGRLELVEGEREIARGIRVRPTPGHTPHHQSVILDGGDGETLLYVADLVPTAHHVPLPWIMGYDVEPLVTLESKRALLAEALAGEWLVMFEHDAATPWGRLARDGKGYRLAD
jgi:glyoxylase-like metal-dependent hydrolase (beta-lactamase superfamily II)